MGLAEAMLAAAAKGCDLHWDGCQQLWVVSAIAYDADACSLSVARLAEIEIERFLIDYIPDRL